MDDIKNVVTETQEQTSEETAVVNTEETAPEAVQNNPEKLSKTKTNDKEKWCYPLIIMVWCQTILLQYVRAFIGAATGLTVMDVIIAIAFVAASVVALANASKKIRAVDIVAFLLIIAIYLLSYWLHMNENVYLDEITPVFIFETLPYFFVGLLWNFDKMKKVLYWLSVATIFAFLFYYVILGGGNDISQYEWQEDMNSSYNLLPHVLLVMLFMFDRPNVINVVTSALGGILILSLGTRGPVLFVLAFMAIEFIFARKSKSGIKFKVVFLGIIGVILINLQSVLLILQDIFKSFGLSLRVITKLLENEITNTSSRDEIYDTILGKIGESPIVGYGVAGDRQFLDGTYSHNLVLELWVSFGVIFGTCILALLCFVVIKALRNCKDSMERGFVLLLVLCGFAKLFLSNSYLSEKMLFILLGVSISMIRRKKSINQSDPALRENSSKYIKDKIKKKFI